MNEKIKNVCYNYGRRQGKGQYDYSFNDDQQSAVEAILSSFLGDPDKRGLTDSARTRLLKSHNENRDIAINAYGYGYGESMNN